MCGIVGYVGEKEALPILMDKLEMLTYRGYDSAGIAVSENGHFYVEKTKGKVSDLAAIVQPERGTGSTGLGHTHRRRRCRDLDPRPRYRRGGTRGGD